MKQIRAQKKPRRRRPGLPAPADLRARRHPERLVELLDREVAEVDKVLREVR